MRVPECEQCDVCADWVREDFVVEGLRVGYWEEEGVEALESWYAGGGHAGE